MIRRIRVVPKSCICSAVLLAVAVQVWAAEPCPAPVATLVSLEGTAQVRHEGQSSWQDVAMEATFCPGDMLRVGGGRAAVVLANEAVLRLSQESTIHFPANQEQHPVLLRLLRGMLHIFSHRPRALQIATPYVNGSVEGTEFLVQVRPDSSVITVYEGVVVAANEQGRVELARGERAVAEKGRAPRSSAAVRPEDAVAWTLYYPAITGYEKKSGKAGGEGYAETAAADLSVGRVEEARQALERLRQKEPDSSEALALLSIIETVQNNKDEGLDLARRAVAGDPSSAAANLALSYAEQARFDLDAARSALERAAAANPENVLVRERLAEMYLAFGEVDRALAAAREASALDPRLGRTQMVLGFVHLSRLEAEQARAVFERSLALDPSLPLARLGLGLAMIRTGELAPGRSELEIAAALDPGNSLIRSYLGKAYYEEKRDDKAQRQYGIAVELDPADPTPWFYRAILKQSENRPVEALSDLQQSIALNDNRAVYRSRLLLDNDLAARSAALAWIYSDLGFNQAALAEGWKSLQSDPANYSAHRFLADSYGTLPRHEVARVSELLQSQLLQPINITPVQPQLAESDTFILEGAGPARVSFNEFNPLFLRDRLDLQASGVAGSNDTFGDEVALSGIRDRWSYSVGQFYYQTDGIRENNDQDRNIYNGFVQTMVSPKTSVLAEVRYRDLSYGDLSLYFDPADYSSTIRQEDETRSLRAGIRHDLQPDSTLLATAIVSSDDNTATGIEGGAVSLDISSEADNVMAEVQHLYRRQTFNLQSGAGYMRADETDTLSYTVPFTDTIEDDSRTEHINVYGYALVDVGESVQATVGLSGDFLDSPVLDRNQANPKLGLVWEAAKGTLVRAAAFRTVNRRLIYAQTIEPAMVAGFNQFFDDFSASTAWTYGIGIDNRFSDVLYGGAHLFHRDIDVPFTDVSQGLPQLAEDDWQEDIGSAYLYWAPTSWAAVGLDYYYEHFSHDLYEGPQGISDLTTHRLTPQVRLFHPRGFSLGLKAHYIDQTGEFGTTFVGFEEDGDRFWVVDLEAGYRLPKRYGIVTLEVKNLFDEQFRFLDTDPARPRFLPDQQIIARFTVTF